MPKYTEDGKRIVVNKHTGYEVVVLAEQGNSQWLWVHDMDGGDRPYTVLADGYTDLPKYDPARLPKVGEVWDYPPHNMSGILGFRVVDVDEDKGVWRFVDIKTARNAETPEGRMTECTTNTMLFTRKLPETKMSKVSDAPG